MNIKITGHRQKTNRQYHGYNIIMYMIQTVRIAKNRNGERKITTVGQTHTKYQYFFFS